MPRSWAKPATAFWASRIAKSRRCRAKTTTKTERILAFGDIAAAYRIVDRLGMAIEPVQTVFGKTNLRPTGQRGLFAFFRVGAKVVIPEAVQVLAVKNE